MKTFKKHVSVEGLLTTVRYKFNEVKDVASSRSKISITDCLMSGLAVFSLKSPSLLDFEQNIANGRSF